MLYTKVCFCGRMFFKSALSMSGEKKEVYGQKVDYNERTSGYGKTK